MRKRLLHYFVFAMCLATCAYGDSPGTAFTYQGELISNGSPVSGTCDFEFRLFDDSAAGNQVGPTLTQALAIVQGRFTAALDFGDGALNGEGRWLAVRVCCSSPCGPAYTPLAPRVKLTPSPLALALPGLRTQQNVMSPNVVGGVSDNDMMAGVVGATIAGGGLANFRNLVTDNYGFVGGGYKNEAGDSDADPETADAATVAGGAANKAKGGYSAVGGGLQNIATGFGATIAGGGANNAITDSSTVGGGYGNDASGDSSTIAGGVQNTASGDYSTIGGGVLNIVTNDSSTVAGGFQCSAAAMRASVGGGDTNTASGLWSTVGGGQFNTAGGDHSTVAGGINCLASGFNSSVGGGAQNNAHGPNSTVAGGFSNAASGESSFVAGGSTNSAGGKWSFAAGHRAKVRDSAATGDSDGDEGSFVWADATTNTDFTSTGPNQFLARVSGGAKFYSNTDATVGAQLAAGGNSWSMICDRNVKENVTPVDGQWVLDRLVSIPVGEWNLISQSPDIRHVGPMAQDFHAAFGLGESERLISGGDADGVALAAIQGLYQLVQEKDCRIEELATKLASLENLEAKLAALETRMAKLSRDAE